MSTSTVGVVVREVTINASAERIFRALTDPAQLPKWWGEPGQYQCEQMEVDLRVGGHYKTSGTGSDGQPFSVFGEYIRVEPPHLVEYTWNYSWGEGQPPTTVRFELREVGGGTIVRVTHSGFTAEEDRADHEAGWDRVLGWLRRYVEV
jgi:uncharacterized protein YndB with AHSA1/START domain